MGLKLVTPPAEQPISLEEAKRHLRVDFDDDNEIIEAFITAAVDFVDGPGGYLGRALIDQTWDYYFDEFPATGPIEIPLPPLIEILGVFYTDADGTEQEFSSYSSNMPGNPGKVYLPSGGSWPSIQSVSDAVRVRFRAGYLDQNASPPVESVPGSIKSAILIYIGNLYANRESVVVGQTVATVPWAAEQLLRRHRFYLGMA